MKSLARSFLSLTGIERDTEDLVRRNHIDYCGPVMKKTFFIVMDAHRKSQDVITLPNATSKSTITCRS